MFEDIQVLRGRPFIEGLQDCYTLVQKYYSLKFGISLRSYARPNLWYLSPNFNFFQQLYEDEGFFEVGTNPRNITIGDALLFKVGRCVVPNHCAVYVGNGKILHHVTGQRSDLEPYSDKWRNRVQLVVRHPEVEKRRTTVDVEGLKKAPFQVRKKMIGG